MKKYYRTLEGQTKIATFSGTDIGVPFGFHELSSTIISMCSLLQGQIQRIIYVTHGAELLAAKKALIDFPSPKARIEFLLSFPYGEADPVISSVFEYAKKLFEEIYDIRNVLAHEIWKVSDEFKDVVLFSSITEDARYTLASRKLLHKDETTSREIYDATIRYIQRMKVMGCSELRDAVKNAKLCSWILMNIDNFIGEEDLEKKTSLRSAFLVFKGTSHLFEERDRISGTITVQSSFNKLIQG